MSSDLSTPSSASNKRIPVIGIVGGVGAGKSSVVKLVRSLQLHLIDADRIGHAQLEKDSIRDAIVQAFGVSVLNEQGHVDRKALAKLVFGETPEHAGRLARLNAIVHPAIRTEIHHQIQTAPQDADAIILDAALLLESGWAAECDAIVMIDTPLELRRQRVAETRGWSIEEHSRREAAQLPLEKKRQASQFVVDNSGSPEDAATQMEQFLQTVVK